jgi:hypothetical protein
MAVSAKDGAIEPETALPVSGELDRGWAIRTDVLVNFELIDLESVRHVCRGEEQLNAVSLMHGDDSGRKLELAGGDSDYNLICLGAR